MKPLYDHQKESIAFIVPRERTLDASDPGTGKTRTTIEAFAIRRLKGAGCALVIAPKSLLRAAWADDFHSFAPHLTVAVATASRREKAFAENADVYVTNTDAVNWLVKQKPAFWKRFENGMLVVDESSMFKHHTSGRSRALSKVKKFFKYRHLMTGTPNSNTICDLWHQLNVLDDGQRLGTSFYGFRSSVCDPTQVGRQANMVKWSDKPGIEDVVAQLIKDITIRHKFEDCISIPPNHSYIVPYELGPHQERMYKQMREHAVAETLAFRLTGKTISAINGAAVVTKLLQIASGAVYDGAGHYDLVDKGRYELIGDLVEARKNTVVFFNWQHQRDMLIEEFEKRGITFVVVDGSTTDRERENAVKHYQAGFYRVFLAHPQSAAHGLTLTRGTATIWASPTYNLEHFIQGNKRIDRAGQTQRTETIHVIATGTIEEQVAEILQRKDVRQRDLLSVLEKA